MFWHHPFSTKDQLYSHHLRTTTVLWGGPTAPSQSFERGKPAGWVKPFPLKRTQIPEPGIARPHSSNCNWSTTWVKYCTGILRISLIVSWSHDSQWPEQDSWSKTKVGVLSNYRLNIWCQGRPAPYCWEQTPHHITHTYASSHYTICGFQPRFPFSSLCFSMEIHKHAKSNGWKCCGSSKWLFP